MRSSLMLSVILVGFLVASAQAEFNDGNQPGFGQTSKSLRGRFSAMWNCIRNEFSMSGPADNGPNSRPMFDRKPLQGGLEGEQPADDEIRRVVASVLADLKDQYPGRSLVSIEPISYREQLVAGTNYFVRAIATEIDGREQPIHLRIYKTLPAYGGEINLSGWRMVPDMTSPLSHF